MKLLFAAALAAVAATPTVAQDAHAGHADHSAHAPATAARFNLDTPVEAIVADPAGKAVIDKHLPAMTAHPQYEQAKSMGLRQIAAFAPEHLTPELLAKIETDLAAIK